MSFHVRPNPSHPRPTTCDQEYNGLAMSGETLHITDRHLVQRNTMVLPCPPKPFTSPTDTLCQLMQWSNNVWPTSLKHRPPSFPQEYNAQSMSAHSLYIADRHLVSKNTMVPGHVWRNPLHHRTTPCPKKKNGRTMSAQTLCIPPTATSAQGCNGAAMSGQHL